MIYVSVLFEHLQHVSNTMIILITVIILATMIVIRKFYTVTSLLTIMWLLWWFSILFEAWKFLSLFIVISYKMRPAQF